MPIPPRLRAALLGSALIPAALLPAVAQAQQAARQAAQQEDAAPVALAPISVESDPSPVSGGTGYVAETSATATKAAARIEQIARSVSTVTQQEIRDRAPAQIEDALAYTAGVTASVWGVDDRFDQFLLRGFDLGTYGIYRDGLQQKSLNFTGFKTDPWMVERIDVLKGPAGVMYGETDPAGVINIVTKRPRFDEDFAEAFVSWGSHDTGTLGADAGVVSEDGRLALRLTGLARDGANQIGGSENDRLLLAAALGWRPDADTEITILGHVQKDRLTPNGFFPVAGEDYDAALGTLPKAFTENQHAWNKFDTEGFSIGWQASHDLGNGLSLHSSARYARQKTDYRHIYFSYFLDADTMSLAAFTVDETATALTADTRLDWERDFDGFANTASLGLDLQRSVIDGRNGYDGSYTQDVQTASWNFVVTDPAIYQDQKQTLDQAGIYAQTLTRFDNGINLNLGARQSWTTNEVQDRLYGGTTKQSDQAFTLSGGATWELAHGITPYASYAQAFVTNAGTDRNGDAFDPTRGDQIEIGVKWKPEGLNALFSLAAFQIEKTNVLTTDPADVNFQVQTGEVRHRGLEAEARAELGHGFSLIAGATWLDAEITASNDGDVGNRPALAPEVTGQVWLDYRLPKGPFEGLSLGAGARYVGETWGDNANTRKVDAYVVVDAAIRYEVDGYGIALNVSNLLDNDYDATCDASAGCIRGAEREFLLTLSKAF